jgi:hypothetical protein
MSDSAGVPQPGAVPPAKSSKKQMAVAWLIILLLAAAGAGAAYYFRQIDPQRAKVGDCVKQTGGDSIEVTECSDGDADFTVVGRIENKTSIDAGLFACSDFDAATSSYWEGEEGEKGTVLCLAKKK